jgi:hypothetical protein
MSTFGLGGRGGLSTLLVLTTLQEGRLVDLRRECLTVVLRGQINSTSKARVEISRREIEITPKIFISVVTSMTRRQIREISVVMTSGARRISAGGVIRLKRIYNF